MRSVALGVVLALALPALGNAQVDYDGLRGVRELLLRWTEGAPGYTWIDHQEEDDFTRETRQYVEGWGESGVLFLVSSCDAVSILFANQGAVFEGGLVEAIWDEGGIVEYEAQDLDNRLVLTDQDWLERVRTHSELRIRVSVFQNSIASDTFDLTSARLSSRNGSDGAVDVDHVREVFSAIGCGPG